MRGSLYPARSVRRARLAGLGVEDSMYSEREFAAQGMTSPVEEARAAARAPVQAPRGDGGALDWFLSAFGTSKKGISTAAETVSSGVKAYSKGVERQIRAASGLLKRGSRGTEVMTLRALLTAKGFPSWSPPDEFSRETEQSVMAFQRKAGLKPDGVVGSKTWAALKKGVIRDTGVTGGGSRPRPSGGGGGGGGGSAPGPVAPAAPQGVLDKMRSIAPLWAWGVGGVAVIGGVALLLWPSKPAPAKSALRSPESPKPMESPTPVAPPPSFI